MALSFAKPKKVSGQRGTTPKADTKKLGPTFGQDIFAPAQKLLAMRQSVGLELPGLPEPEPLQIVGGMGMGQGHSLGDGHDHFEYDGAEIGRGPSPGILAVVNNWRRHTGLGSGGTWNVRNTEFGNLSVHASGRAADLSAHARNLNQRSAADNWLNGFVMPNAGRLGVQQIIWNGYSWRPGRGWKRYSGRNQHTDHIHLELNRWGGNNTAGW